MANTPHRSGWFEVKGKSPCIGMRFPQRMWFDVENHRWRPTQFDVCVYHPLGDYFRGMKWRGQLQEGK